MPRKKKRGIYDRFNLPKINMEDLVKKKVKLDICKMSNDELLINDMENDKLFLNLVNFLIEIINDPDIGVITKEKIILGLNEIIIGDE